MLETVEIVKDMIKSVGVLNDIANDNIHWFMTKLKSSNNNELFCILALNFIDTDKNTCLNDCTTVDNFNEEVNNNIDVGEEFKTDDMMCTKLKSKNSIYNFFSRQVNNHDRRLIML